MSELAAHRRFIDGPIMESPRTPSVPYDGRWHRWAGLRLAIALDGGGYAVKLVGRLRWMLRWGGEPPRPITWKESS